MSIDLTDLITDPDICNAFKLQCYRRTRTTNSMGKAVINNPGEAFGITASVFPANGRQLQRLKESDRTEGTIAVYTTNELLVEAAGYAADIVVWKNQNYIVSSLDDYSTNGFFVAICTLTSVVGPVPGTYPG
jgi:hypothetical protein